MNSGESDHPCALARDRAQAETFVKWLAAAGIEATLAVPGPRYNRLTPGAWEVRVPASQAARARALLPV